MEKRRILYISQEIMPYLPETDMSYIGRYLPQGIQERGNEIRSFMPKYGVVNERRHQLHEVIRLSGMNVIIDDTDHPLIIKVASIQAARMQIYFIDNEDYFHRKFILFDDKGVPFEDNDERCIFFARGVLETVRKLRWSPDIIHCHGWVTGLIPLYIRNAYQEDPLFSKTKVIYSAYYDDFDHPMNPRFKEKLKIDGIAEEDVEMLTDASYVNLVKLATQRADGIIMGVPHINEDLHNHILSLNKPFLPHQSRENLVESYSQFYDQILAND